MNQLTRLTTATPLGGLFLLPLVLAWITFAPTAQAVTPAPDGGYPNGNTAEGKDALFSLTTGRSNTAIVFIRSSATQLAASTRPTALLLF
jgi:hypothetical protein